MTPPEINVDQLMHQIRQAVALRAREIKPDAPLASSALNGGAGQTDRLGLALQPEFQPSSNGYHANDLLKYHGEVFVRNAYRAILKREPDADGMATHLESLANGRFNKIDVLAGLRRSEEGRQAGVKITGLTWPATIRRFERIPIVGYLLELVIAMLRLPVLLRSQRQHEFYALARQEQIVNYVSTLDSRVGDTQTELTARAGSIEGDIRAQRETFESAHGELNSALVGLRHEIAGTNEALRELELRTTVLAAQLDETTADINGRFEDHGARHDALHAELRILADDKDRLVVDLALQERRLADMFELAEIQSGLAEEELDELYVAFEDQFRGEFEEIKNRLRVYLTILDDAKISADILDIGCGRGEWLDLLRETGRDARGVDHNRIFVERCRQAGLSVVQADAIGYLRGLPDASLNALTSFHLVEHLPFKILISFLDETYRVLRPHSPLILETPNPGNLIVGSHTFYSDPTHRNPIPSPTLRFLLESRGFSGIEVMNVRPWNEAKIAGDDELTKRFNEYFYASPDYGIVGWKN